MAKLISNQIKLMVKTIIQKKNLKLIILIFIAPEVDIQWTPPPIAKSSFFRPQKLVIRQNLVCDILLSFYKKSWRKWNI
jgi:hypothetical protein